MKTKPIEVKAKGFVIKIFVTRCVKGDKVYTNYQVADYSSGKRKLHGFADESDARAKALEIAGCTANGERDLISFSDIKRPIQNALDEARAAGLPLDDAVRLVRQAGEIIPIGQVLDACRYWKDRGPDKPFTPKTVKEATTDYLSRQHRVSERRQRGLKCYFDQLVVKFGNRYLHEVTAVDIKDFADSKPWSPKTYNEVLNSYALVYKEAQLRDWVPAGCNPCADIKRLKMLPCKIGVFEPGQVRTILSSVKEDLIPFVAIWCFAGARKEEVTRLKWPQIRSALKTGVLEIEADQGLKTGRRSVPLQSNLRAWLEWFIQNNPDVSGFVLPTRYSEGRRLDNLQDRIACQSKVEWIANGPRHSFITYRCKVTGSVVDVSDECGNSPAKIEKHYRKRGVTLEAAQEFFNILPPVENNVIPMPKSAIG